MASVGNDPNGLKRVVFHNQFGKRKQIRLGKVPQSYANTFAAMVQSVVNDVRLRQPHTHEVVKWLKDLPRVHRTRLEATGLVTAPPVVARTLKELLDKIIRAAEVKDSTRVTYGQTRDNLIAFFGEDADFTHIGPADAEAWRRRMVDDKFAKATISKRVKTARLFFRTAAKWKLLPDNPFADLKAGGEANPARMFFITQEMAEKVVAACPDAEWRLLFGLSRYAGLRCPSEHLALTWDDVHWDDRALRVREAKTKERLVPIDPRLMPLLREAYELADEGADHLIVRYRRRNSNLRTQLLRIIRRAGLIPWPRAFHNLRSSCQTEWVEHHPIQDVVSWIGNSEAIAMRHYLQPRSVHFEAATMTDEEVAAEAAKKTGKQIGTSGGNAGQAGPANPAGAVKTAIPSGDGRNPMTLTGLEQPRKTFGKHGRPDQNGTKSGALDSLSDEERVSNALALVDAAFKVMSRKAVHS